MTIKFVVETMLHEGMTSFRFFHHEIRRGVPEVVSAGEVLESIEGMEDWPVVAISMGVGHSTTLADRSKAYFHPERCDITFRFPGEELCKA